MAPILSQSELLFEGTPKRVRVGSLSLSLPLSLPLARRAVGQSVSCCQKWAPRLDPNQGDWVSEIQVWPTKVVQARLPENLPYVGSA